MGHGVRRLIWEVQRAMQSVEGIWSRKKASSPQKFLIFSNPILRRRQSGSRDSLGKMIGFMVIGFSAGSWQDCSR